ncbi:hypothetical protein BT69DRAFT_1351937 [Atractiella rhizophila]|nr:hypothetical protein BT69DRAFT_1351937 [Atractiella rhizophila]
MSSISRLERARKTYERISATRTFRYSAATTKFVFRHKVFFSSLFLSAYGYKKYQQWKDFVAKRDAIPESVFLHWKIYPGAIVEAKAGSGFLSKLVSDDGSSAELPHVMTTFEVIRTLKRIQTDDRVKGIFADFSAETPAGLTVGGAIGLAQIEEIQRALHETKRIKDERFQAAWEAEHGPVSDEEAITKQIEGADGPEQLEKIVQALEAMDESVGGDQQSKALNVAVPGKEGEVEIQVQVVEGPETFRTIAYADEFHSQGQFLLASAFEEVFMQPTGHLPLTGITSHIPFYSRLLEWIGIKFHADARNEYKSMVSPYITDTLPEKQKDNQIELLTDMHNILISHIARNRFHDLTRDKPEGSSLEVEMRRIHELAKIGPISASKALEVGLISGTAYKDDLLSDLKDIEDNEGPKRWGFYHYSQAVERALFGQKDSPKQFNVGVVYLLGEISSTPGPFSTSTVLRGLREAAEDPDIDAIVLRVDSPGGGALESDTIWGAIQDLRQRKGKIVVASMANMAASGGYMVSAPTDYIVAAPSTITGSIGVAALRPIVTQALLDKIKISLDHFTIGSRDDSIFVDPDPEMLKRYGQRADELYVDFKRKVCEGRSIDENLIEYIAGGRVMTGLRVFEFGANKNNVDSLRQFFPVLPVNVEVSRSAPLPSSSSSKKPALELAETKESSRTEPDVLAEASKVVELDPDQETSPYAPPTPSNDEMNSVISSADGSETSIVSSILSTASTSASSSTSLAPSNPSTPLTESDFPLGAEVIHQAIGRGLIDALGGISDSASIAAEMAINRAFLAKQQENPEKSNQEILEEIIPGIQASEEDGKMNVSMDVNLKVFPQEKGFVKTLLDDMKRGDSLEEPRNMLGYLKLNVARWMYEFSRTILLGHIQEATSSQERELRERLIRPKLMLERSPPRV